MAKGLERDDLSGTFQPNPFYDSVKILDPLQRQVCTQEISLSKTKWQKSAM